MKPFIHVLLASGHLYEIPTAVIAEDRAKTMLAAHPDEFADIEAAKADTNALFDNGYQIKDWAMNNMGAKDLMQEARLVRYTPPAPDFQDGEWSFHDAAAIIPQLDPSTVLASPVELAVAAMAAHRNICQLALLNDTAGKPYAAVALIQGGEGIVNGYVGALTAVTEAITSKPADAATN